MLKHTTQHHKANNEYMRKYMKKRYWDTKTPIYNEVGYNQKAFGILTDITLIKELTGAK